MSKIFIKEKGAYGNIFTKTSKKNNRKALPGTKNNNGKATVLINGYYFTVYIYTFQQCNRNKYSEWWNGNLKK